MMLPGGGTVVAFRGRICKCLGANARGFPGVNPPGWPLISANLVETHTKRNWKEIKEIKSKNQPQFHRFLYALPVDSSSLNLYQCSL